MTTFREGLAAKILALKNAGVEKLAEEPTPAAKEDTGPVREVSSEMLADGSELVKYSDGTTRRCRFETFGEQQRTFGK